MNYISKKPYIVFILPGFLIYTVFVVYPIFYAVAISFTSWSGFGAKTFVGFSNYIEIFTNPYYYNALTNALRNNIIILFLTLFIVTPLQIYTAYVICNKVRGHKFFQVMIYSPQFIATTVVVFLGTLVFDGNIGIFNKLLELIGLEEFVKPWLRVPELGILPAWSISVWAGIGMGMIFFMSAIKMIPKEMIDAASIDGANSWTILLKIVIPQIKMTIINVILLVYILSITFFDYSYLLGGAAGGINGSVDVISLLFYRTAFGSVGAIGGTINKNAMGIGATIATLLFGLIFIIVVLQIRITYKKENIK